MMAAKRYALPLATQKLLGDDHGLADPQRWVATRLRSGMFRGQKIGRQWFMRAVDIEAAEAAMSAPARIDPAAAALLKLVETGVTPAIQPSVIGGLSARAARRIARDGR